MKGRRLRETGGGVLEIVRDRMRGRLENERDYMNTIDSGSRIGVMEAVCSYLIE